MSKHLALFIFSLILFVSFYSNDSITKGISAVAVPTATPTPAVPDDSFRMELDRYTVIYPCPTDLRCMHGKGDNNLAVEVTISNTELENDSLRFKYTSSGGRIIGEGAKVIWVLTGEMSGTYKITAAIEDKTGKELQLITKVITLFENDENGDWCLMCPKLSVDAPNAPTQAGDAMIFTAKAVDDNSENMTYDWTVKGGKIIEGQGTATIKVATDSAMAGKVVEATVKFNWDCSEICPNTASASNLVKAKKRRDK